MSEKKKKQFVHSNFPAVSREHVESMLELFYLLCFFIVNDLRLITLNFFLFDI